MDFNDLINLTKDEAQKLFEKYCAARDDYLLKLSEVAAQLGISLPQHADGYGQQHLTSLGAVVPAILSNRAICRSLPKTPEWLACLLDTGSSRKNFADAQVWVGVACSYAFQSIVLNSRDDVRLAVGNLPIRRYVYQNQPVITGTLYGAEEPMDAPPLAVGCRALWDIEDGDYDPEHFGEFYRILRDGPKRCQPPRCE